MLIERLITGGLLLLLVLSPLPFGAVQPEWAGALAAGTLILGALWTVWRARRGVGALPWRSPVLIAGLLFAAIGLIQLVPLPPPVLERISPESAAIRAEFAPPGKPAEGEGAGTAGWEPVSVYPWATRHSLLRTLACMLAALIAFDLASAGPGRRLLAWGLLAAGLFQASYGLVEYVSGHQHIFGYPKVHATDAATGTFINRNHLAGHLEMTLPFALALGAMAFARAREGGSGSGIRRLASASGRQLFTSTALLLAALLMATALVCSRSRMGMVSAVLSLIAVGLTMTRGGERRGFILAGVLVASATLLIFGQAGFAPVVQRFMTAPEHLASGLGRWSIWAQSVSILEAYPVLGSGMGTFPHLFAYFRTETPGVALIHAHNDYLEMAAETGWAGCLVFAAGTFLILRVLLRRGAAPAGFGYLGHAAAAGVIAVALHSVTDFNLAIPSNAYTFSVLVGLLAAWRRSPAPVLAASRAGAGGWPARSAAVAIPMLAAAVLASAPILGRVEASRGPGGGEEAGTGPGTFTASILTDGDDALALRRRAAAVAAPAIEDLQAVVEGTEQGRFPSREVLSYVRRRLAAAIRIQEEGIRALPVHASGHLSLGRLKVALCSVDALGGTDQRRCVEEARADLQAALRLNPMGARIHARVARLYLGAWPLLGPIARSEARTVIARAMEMNPEDEELWRASAGILASR